MALFKKEDYVNGLVLILDMPLGYKTELRKLSTETLAHIYEGQKKNAIAYQELLKSVQIAAINK